MRALLLSPYLILHISIQVIILYPVQAFSFISKPLSNQLSYEKLSSSLHESTFSTNNDEEITSGPFSTPSSSNYFDNTNVETYTAIPKTRYSKEEAQSIISNILYPQSEYKNRMRMGYQYTGIEDDHNQKPLTNEDERLRYTYAEFPVESFHQLTLDRAFYWKSTLEQVQRSEGEGNENMKRTERRENHLVDIGSGCAQLVLYASLALNGNGQHRINKDEGPFGEGDSMWHVHGIEISPSTHNYGVQMLERGIKENIFQTSNIQEEESDKDKVFEVSLNLGPAAACETLLSKADIIFSYSSVFNTVGFSTTVGGMILAPEWSEMLAQRCKNGCVVVTTDRALDPAYGWTFLEKLDVENPDLIGSTGFIQMLDKNVFQASVINPQEGVQESF